MRTVLTIVFLLLWAFCQTASAHVEKYYYLWGNLGGKKIAMKIYCYDEGNARYATYFFAAEKKDRYLKGTLENKVWTFSSYEIGHAANNMGPKESFSLSENPDKSWTGGWSNTPGDTLPICLTPIKTDSVQNNYRHLLYIQELDPYDYYKMSDISFTVLKTEHSPDGMVCSWLNEPLTGISLFRISDTQKKINTDSVNIFLETTHLALVNKSLSFNPASEGSKLRAELRFMNKQLVSYELNTEANFSGGAPVNERQLITLFVKSGKLVALEDLLWFDVKTAPTIDLDKWLEYRKTVFEQSILKLLKELYPDKVNSFGCNYNNSSLWRYPTWCLTRQGLYVGSLHGDMSKRDCDLDNWSVIPYYMLKSFWNKDYPISSK